MTDRLVLLDLCSGSGAWSRPYLEAGWDVHYVDLPGNDVLTYMPPPIVHGILAAPPCDQFSLARTRASKPRNLPAALEIVKACYRIIWECRLRTEHFAENPLMFWALENPFGLLRQFLGIPPLTFYAYEYGDNWKKRTDVFGYFNIPPKTPLSLLPGTLDLSKVSGASGTSDQKAKARSVTPPGFSLRFYQANH